jgi:hypothetical protein
VKPKPHFKVERHSETEWRIVNARIGHGLIFPDEKVALKIAKRMNAEMKLWLEKDIVPEHLLLDRIVKDHPTDPGEDTGGGHD